MTESQFETKKGIIGESLIESRVFAPFFDANHKLMQRLLTGEKNGNGQPVDFPRLPITVSKLEQVRLGRLGANGDREQLRKTNICTATLVLPDPNSNAVMTVPEHPLIYVLSENTELEENNIPITKIEEELIKKLSYRFIRSEGRNLPITKDIYEASRELPYSFEFTIEQANELRNKPYSQPKVRRAAWESWNKGNLKLLDDYIKDIKKSIRCKFNKYAMGIVMPQNNGGRLLYVDCVHFWNKSNADCGSCLSVYYGQLFGEVAEPHDVSKKIEEAKAWAKQFPDLEGRL